MLYVVIDCGELVFKLNKKFGIYNCKNFLGIVCDCIICCLGKVLVYYIVMGVFLN